MPMSLGAVQALSVDAAGLHGLGPTSAPHGVSVLINLFFVFGGGHLFWGFCLFLLL